MQQLRGLCFAAVIVIAIGLPVPGAGQTECEADHQCQLDQFCYVKTGYCTLCINCRNYNRYPSEHQNCAKGFEDCGSCIQGYKEEVLSGHEKRHFCKRTPTSTAAPINEKTDSTNNESPVPHWAIYVGVAIGTIVILLIVILLVGLWYKKYKAPATDANLLPQSSSEEPFLRRPHPPPYAEFAVTVPSGPLYPSPPPPSPPSSPKPASAPVFEAVTQDRSHVISIYERGENDQQQAVRFIDPQGTYADSDNDSSETDDQAVGAITPPNPANLDDEDTMPSTWVPGNQESESDQASEARETGDNSRATLCDSRVTLGDSRVTLGDSRTTLGDSRTTLGDSRVTLDDSGNSSTVSLDDIVGSTAQGTVMLSVSARPNSLRRSLSSSEPQNAAKKPRSDSGCSSEAGEEPDVTNLPEAPTINNSSDIVITNNIFIGISINKT